MFTILRNCQTVFQKDCILHSHQQCMRVPVSPFYSHLSQLNSVRLFPSFLTAAAFDKVVIDNIKVPEFKVRCQSSLCLTYKQHLTHDHSLLLGILFFYFWLPEYHTFIPTPPPHLPFYWSILLSFFYYFLSPYFLEQEFPLGIISVLLYLLILAYTGFHVDISFFVLKSQIPNYLLNLTGVSGKHLKWNMSKAKPLLFSL